MDFKNKPSFEKIKFYTTTEYNCSYIDKMDAQSLVVTPYKSINQNTFQDLIEKGFRRSGQYIYKPNCISCTVLEGVGNIYISQTAKVAQHVSPSDFR